MLAGSLKIPRRLRLLCLMDLKPQTKAPNSCQDRATTSTCTGPVSNAVTSLKEDKPARRRCGFSSRGTQKTNCLTEAVDWHITLTQLKAACYQAPPDAGTILP